MTTTNVTLGNAWQSIVAAELGEGIVYARAQGDSATITLTTWTIP